MFLPQCLYYLYFCPTTSQDNRKNDGSDSTESDDTSGDGTRSGPFRFDDHGVNLDVHGWVTGRDQILDHGGGGRDKSHDLGSGSKGKVTSSCLEILSLVMGLRPSAGSDQHFGADQDIVVTPTGGVDQDYGGPMIESSTVANPMEMAVSDYVTAVDTMGKGAMAGYTGKVNPLTMTTYSMDTPPVSVRSDEPTMSMGTPDPSVQEVSPYFKPPTTADVGESYILGSHTVVNAGQPMQFYGAEGLYSTTIGNHVRGAEGNGSVFGM